MLSTFFNFLATNFVDFHLDQMAAPLTPDQLALLSVCTSPLGFLPSFPGPLITTTSSSITSISTDLRGPEGCNIFIFGIPEGWAESDLVHVFSPFGVLLSAKVERDRPTGKSRGFGFASFAEPRAAAAAISFLHGTTIQGRTVTVKLKKDNNESQSRSQQSLQPSVSDDQQLQEQHQLHLQQTRSLEELHQAQLAHMQRHHVAQQQQQQMCQADEREGLQMQQQQERQQQTHTHDSQRQSLLHQQELHRRKDKDVSTSSR